MFLRARLLGQLFEIDAIGRQREGDRRRQLRHGVGGAGGADAEAADDHRHQWYWSYEYPDNGGITLDANLNDKAAPELRLLDTDNHILVPVNTKVRLLTTAEDVIHSWAMPSFGVKLDAVPGRINETWFEVLREGTYYGQCSELCGNNHGFMPIVVEAVSKDKFDAWVQQKKAAMNNSASGTTVAAVASSN